MLKLWFTFAVLTAVAGDFLTPFEGTWWGVYTFNLHKSGKTCDHYIVSSQGIMQCTCEGAPKEMGVLRVASSAGSTVFQDYNTVVVTSQSEVERALNEDCLCPQKLDRVALNKLNEDYALGSERFSHVFQQNLFEDNWVTFLISRKNVTETELLDIVNSTGLSKENGKILCKFN